PRPDRGGRAGAKARGAGEALRYARDAVSSTSRRFPLVDSMRAVAALSVILFHVTYWFPIPRNEVWQYLSQRNAGPPLTGVVLFFLISGFVLYRPFAQARFEGRSMPALFPYAVRRVA